MENIIRTFLPVGQGAFYLESFGYDKKIIYDCGSENYELLKKVIDKYVTKQTIDALFISHFHYDHISGIDYLLNKENKVKKVIMPYMSKQERALLLISNLRSFYEEDRFKENSFIFDIIMNPEEYFGKKNIDIIFIKEKDKVSSKENNLEKIELEKVSEKQKYLESGCKLMLDTALDWAFIPFNFRETNRGTKALSNLKDKCPEIFHKDSNDIRYDYLYKNWVDLLGDIKESFKNVRGDMNTNSMVLYSGPLSKNKISHYKRNIFCCDNTILYNINCLKCILEKSNNISQHYKIGCLYTGDYNAKGKYKFKDIMNRFEPYKEFIGTIQIPHHGSKYNYNKHLIDDDCAVISCGLNNKYRHPHKEVLDDLLEREIDLGIVNETNMFKEEIIL